MFRLRAPCNWRVGLLSLGLMCWALTPARAQVSKGNFTGSVTDPTGASVPRATVTATNEGTNVSVSRQSSSDGYYTIPDLLPGFYTLKAEAKGFKSLVNQHVELTVGYTQRVDFKLQVGELAQAITVESQAPLVDTQTSRMSELITAQQVQNIPLNGRNVFQLMNLAPGAVDTTNLITEPGSRGNLTTVVNGARVNMNGYLLDGISDKGLSGGSNTLPSVDTVQEFRVDTEVVSAQYGSTVGAMTSIVTKSGTNLLHGTVYEYLRNDKLNTRNFFEKDKGTGTSNVQPGTARTPFRMNQFGGTAGGPIKKNKMFFFGSYEGERTIVPVNQEILIETPQWRSFVNSNFPNSVAGLLYTKFPGPNPSSGLASLATYVTSPAFAGNCTTFDAACLNSAYGIAPGSALSTAMLNASSMPVVGFASGTASLRSLNQFYTGNQVSGKIDIQGDKNKIFGRFFFDRYSDPTFTPATNGGSPTAFVGSRGFTSPFTHDFPNFAFGWSHTFGPSVLNEWRMGWSRNVGDFSAGDFAGVPQIGLDTGEVSFGSYNGYPQLFHENVFHFADMVTWTRGRHTWKFGGELQRNYENSEFNVGRPSYSFADAINFAQGNVELEAAGVDPGQVDPRTGASLGQAHLSSNIRAWRNWEFGAFINDDWKVSPRLTLTLGLRYDLYTRHDEKYGQISRFVLPQIGANLTERLRAVNCFENISGGTGFDGQPCNGGFDKNPSSLTTGAHKNFGPRVGFAWDVRGDGKTALRGGFGVSYQGEIYNPLSNSRWNPPFYSFNLSFCGDGTNNIGPGKNSCVFGPVGGGTPTFTGPPSNVGSGPAGASFDAFGGNIQGWNPWNSNAAFLTGIVFPNFRDPYVYGSHLSLEHEFPGNMVVKVSWVGTFAHKLYRAEDINRAFGGRTSRFGSGPFPNGACTSGRGPYRVNCLFGRLRNWQNSVSSNYDALQVVLDKRMSHGLELHANYVWSHSLDTRSTWHSGATTSNGAAEGFSMDQAHPELDYGHSVFDVRHRFSTSFVWDMPWLRQQRGLTGHAFGGWKLNASLSFRGGFPWTPYCSRSSSPKPCDFNQDGVSNDRPDQPAGGNSINNDRAVFEKDNPSLNITSLAPILRAPTRSVPYNGNMGRNTFRGPNSQVIDLSLVKNFNFGESRSLEFRTEAFNLFNRTNLQMPSATFSDAASQFGLSTAAYASRQIQFALKFHF